jgi:LmbE family N-acetylglucosaminyl deacetylase
LAGAVALVLLASAAPAQQWRELQGRSRNGLVELHQAVRDAGTDVLALLIASHPDDRYVLPATVLRWHHGARIDVLFATRGGGGQNSRGPETGDALERIRSLEAEAACSLLDASAWHLNRPDGGFRRTAEETFAEWGREGTERELVRLIRTIRPDLVVSTHHAEEDHGHDLALVQLLPAAVAHAADPAYAVAGLPPHRVQRLFLGAPSSPPPGTVRVALDQIEPVRGATFRRLAYDLMDRTQPSVGPMPKLDQLYEPVLALQPVPLPGEGAGGELLAGLRSMFDDGIWPAAGGDSVTLRADLAALPALLLEPERLVARALEVLARLRALPAPQGSEFERRCARRIDALERAVRLCCGIQVEVETEPGAVAVPGEELHLSLRVHNGDVREIEQVRAEVAGGGQIAIEPVDGEALRVARGATLRAALVHHVPLVAVPAACALAGDRFAPPLQLLFQLTVAGCAIPLRIVVPVELRPPVDLEVVPPMLLLPDHHRSVQFTVAVHRNSAFPVVGNVELLAPASYVIEGARRKVDLRESRGDTFGFELRAPENRKPGVDVVRIQVGGQRLRLPVHKVDVAIDPALRIGLVRGNDDALLSVIGIGGFGLRWSELSDADLAVRPLDEFDTVVVDVRALRDRPRAQRNFPRLLEFARGRGRRLLVFYHKDTEYHPPGESFAGAPYLPFQVGRTRVTRADAPVRVLLPMHDLLRVPNLIEASDWDAWEQERALYLPNGYAEQYQELLAMNDPGQPVERGALLFARTDEGEFVYCALALYRQVKKLHAGAIRLLANLLTPGNRGR